MAQRVLMSAFAIFLWSLILTGCGQPSIDLRSPLCIIRDMKNSPPGWTSSNEWDLNHALTNGPNFWFKHIPNLVPLPFYTDDESLCSNPPIKVYVVNTLKDACATIKYNNYFTGYHLTLSKNCITPHAFAHELGHALWTFQHILFKLSIMSPDGNFYVTPDDMQMMCEEHPEINCPEFKWCEGTFFDQYRCPSDSPEDGQNKLTEGKSLNDLVKIRERIRRGQP